MNGFIPICTESKTMGRKKNYSIAVSYNHEPIKIVSPVEFLKAHGLIIPANTTTINQPTLTVDGKVVEVHLSNFF